MFQHLFYSGREIPEMDFIVCTDYNSYCVKFFHLFKTLEFYWEKNHLDRPAAL